MTAGCRERDLTSATAHEKGLKNALRKSMNPWLFLLNDLFGVGYGVSKLYEEIGLTNPYANATATGATAGGLLAGGGELAASALSRNLGRAAVRTALSSAAKGIDQLTNMGYRASAMDAANAGWI